MPSPVPPREAIRRRKAARYSKEGRLLPVAGTPKRLLLLSHVPKESPGVTIKDLTKILDRTHTCVQKTLRGLELAGHVKREGFSPATEESRGHAAYLFIQTQSPPDFLPLLASGRPDYPRARHRTLRILFQLLDLPASADDLFHLLPEASRPRTIRAISKRIWGLRKNNLVTPVPGRRGEWTRTPLWEDIEKDLPPLPEIE